MIKATTEEAYESYIVDTLVKHSGWRQGSVSDWDVKRALFVPHILTFIEKTQPDLWHKMRSLHDTELEAKITDALCRELDKKGTLHVLRHGFKFFGQVFHAAYFRPAHGLNPDVKRLYEASHLTVTRQVPCHPNDTSELDLLLAVNGIPVATCELKNPNTHQTWRNAVEQYRTERDPNAPVFRFKRRALVHFAVDPDEVHMTTRLTGENTRFLPFNRGSSPGDRVKCGAGNPPNENGHRTAYLWEDVLKRDSLLDILGSFMFIERRESRVKDESGARKLVSRETLVFPRYHQLDSVRRLVRAARKEGAGHSYLVQHSAGSGKTNSISWLSHRLASLHDENDGKVFDCVVVITDRQVLDRQLQDAIYQIEHAQGVVKAIDRDSKQLAEALLDGTRIVVTTLQKFPFVLKGLTHNLSGGDYAGLSEEEKFSVNEKAATYGTEIAARRYAVIVDEAHSSQTGESAAELKAVLGSGTGYSEGGDPGGEASAEDVLNSIVESRGRQKNLSFFAFTATPKGKTLNLFGRTGASGKPEEFHNYSMRQAIEEGFILNVLSNYTTYKMYYGLVKAIEDDPNLPEKKARKSLAKYMSLHPHNVEQKTEIMVEHFRRNVQSRIGGRAKAMVVTGSRLAAVRYMLAFKKYIEENDYEDIRPLVAFSGTVSDPKTGGEYTEPQMNTDAVTGKGISEAQLPERFASDDYQILLVANKYQTGFDQPLLQAMYVDKRLADVQAVQTLSRLNRIHPGKEAPFVLDFVNDPDDIYTAFKPYYDTTALENVAEPEHLDTLKYEMDEMQVYHASEVEAFASIFYKPAQQHVPGDHARMEKHLQPAVDRFKGLEEDQRELFREKLSGYVGLYTFLAQIMPWSDPDLEKLYSFGRFLLPHLPIVGDISVINPEDDVALRYYRLQRISSGQIDLDTGDVVEVKSPTDVGTGKATDENAPLSSIIGNLNDRFGTEFGEEDRLFFEQIKEKAVADGQISRTAEANPLDKFELGIRQRIQELMMQRISQNDEIVTRYMEDEEFQDEIFPLLAQEIFDSVRKGSPRRVM